MTLKDYKFTLKRMLDTLAPVAPYMTVGDFEIYRVACVQYFMAIEPIVHSDIEIKDSLKPLYDKYL